jgi:hypothetical protein
MATSDNSLHEHALAAEKNLEALATGLAEAGASPETIKAVTQMAEVARQLVSALGAGQEQTGDDEPAAAEEPGTIDQATAETHQAMQASAAQRNA